MKGDNDSDGILIKVSEVGISNFAKLSSGMKFTETKLIRIKKVTVIDVGDDLIKNRTFEYFAENFAEQED